MTYAAIPTPTGFRREMPVPDHASRVDGLEALDGIDAVQIAEIEVERRENDLAAAVARKLRLEHQGVRQLDGLACVALSKASANVDRARSALFAARLALAELRGGRRRRVERVNHAGA